MFSCTKLLAQLSFSHIEAREYIGLNFFQYADKPMVLSREKGTADIEGDHYAVAQAFFHAKNKNMFFGAGLGYGQKFYAMSKYKPADILLIFFPGYSDTQHIKRVETTGKFVTVTLSFSYTFSKKEHATVKFCGGVSVVNYFKAGATAKLSPDTLYFKPSAQEIDNLQKAYSAEVKNYTVKIQANLELEISFSKQVGLKLGIVPVQRDLMGWTNLVSGAIGTGCSFSFYYKPGTK